MATKRKLRYTDKHGNEIATVTIFRGARFAYWLLGGGPSTQGTDKSVSRSDAFKMAAHCDDIDQCISAIRYTFGTAYINDAGLPDPSEWFMETV